MVGLNSSIRLALIFVCALSSMAVWKIHHGFVYKDEIIIGTRSMKDAKVYRGHVDDDGQVPTKNAAPAVGSTKAVDTKKQQNEPQVPPKSETKVEASTNTSRTTTAEEISTAFVDSAPAVGSTKAVDTKKQQNEPQLPPKSETKVEASTNISRTTTAEEISTASVDSNFDVLPKALRLDPSLIPPSTMGILEGNAQCCSHWIQNKHRDRKRPLSGKARTCSGICYTPQACGKYGLDGGEGNGFYPFRDRHEKKKFPLRQRETDTKPKLNHCLRPSPYFPPIEWNTSSQFPFQSLPELGCSRFTGGGGSGSFQNLYIIPSAKLAFCGIPKVGITAWKQFIRYVMGAHDYLSLPYAKPDLKMWNFDLLAPEVQQEIWNDEEWTFAAILRDPAERLLSAYLDKLQIKRRGGSVAKDLKLTSDFTFKDFLVGLDQDPPDALYCRDSKNGKNATGLTGIHWCSDPHWRPQVWGCGMSEKIDRFDFLGTLDRVSEHAKALLEKVDLWESHGKFYRNRKSNRTQRADSCNALFQLQDEVDSTPLHLREFGFQQHRKKDPNKSHDDSIGRKKTRKSAKARGKPDPWDVVGHAQGADGKIKEYYTPEMLQKVRELYRADYEVWDLVTKREGGWASGKDIVPDLLKGSTKIEKYPDSNQ